jgi:glycosyltransferase involved in cell wall biosynthesis
MKIAYIYSQCTAYDAIGNMIHREITWLQNAGHEVFLFSETCDHSDLPFIRATSIADVVFNQFFQTCHKVIFHFGIFYQLFNLLPIVPQHAKRIVVFHNITPKEFVRPSLHGVIESSFKQLTNVSFAHHVICDSKTNLKVLRRAGVKTPGIIIPLSIDHKLKAPIKKLSFNDRIFRIIFLSRLVPSKGPVDLMKATLHLIEKTKGKIRINIVGNTKYSDDLTLAQVQNDIQTMTQRFPKRFTAKFHGTCSEQEKRRMLIDADLLVLPTYHEGFCLPIPEALASGCCVVAYDNSNVPAISGGLATLVPTGNIERLSQALIDLHNLIRSEYWKTVGYLQHVHAARNHVAQFRSDLIEKRYLNFIENLS